MMSTGRLQITLEPAVLRWARERARLEPQTLATKVGVKPERVAEWEESGKISFSQANRLAMKTHTPVGYLYLPAPPEDQLPIPDFRTVGDRPLDAPSPNLLETVQQMQRRQAWMREEMIEQGQQALGFVGSVDSGAEPVEVAARMREALGLDVGWARQQPNWTAALKLLRDHVEAAGILIVINGVVGNNTHRPLDVEEFRGFALIDEYAPLIFVNNGDFKAAQMFTIAHELAHIWLGEPGVSNFDSLEPAPHEVERRCNQIAAEFLVPAEQLAEIWRELRDRPEPFQAVAHHFKVSSIVAARRALDLGLIQKAEFLDFYRAWQADERRQAARREPGGSFWNNQNVRIGHRFGSQVVRAAKEGRLLYQEAYALTGLTGRTFEKFARNMGM
jgi:Zn-dependent peptidase ImmA (M78 family)